MQFLSFQSFTFDVFFYILDLSSLDQVKILSVPQLYGQIITFVILLTFILHDSSKIL